MDKVNEKFFQTEQKRMENKKQIEAKSQNTFIKQEKFLKAAEERRKRTLERSQDKFHNTMINIKANKENIEYQNKLNSQGVLYKQYEIINSMYEKEKTLKEIKLNIVDNSIVNGLGIMDDIKKFNYELNRIKEKSISKLNQKQRLEIYKKLKQEERERKKKEEEKKLKEMGLL